MNDPLIDAFEDCLRAMETGATLEAALARYPQLAAELRPLLLAARAARPAKVIRVPRQSEEASHARFMARARELRPTRNRGMAGWWPQFSLVPRLAFAVLALALGGFGVVTASASSLPGDPLYGVKRTVEQAQLSLTPAEGRPALEQGFEQRRIEEVHAVLSLRRQTEVEFSGPVESLSGSRGVVRGITVIAAGAWPASVAVGDRVRVIGLTQRDGTVSATRIEELESDALPAPTASATATVPPSLTPQPVESATVAPEVTPIWTPLAPEPTETQSSGGSGPSNTPRPTETPGAPSPGNTPDDDETDEPDATDEPEEEKFEGTLQSTNPWTVDGQVFAVDGQTEFRNNPQVGDSVEVRAYRLTDGTLLARRIEKK